MYLACCVVFTILILFFLAFDQYIYLNQIQKIYTLYHYNIIYNIVRAGLEQAYRSLCKLGSNYIYICIYVSPAKTRDKITANYYK